jgi:peptidyl-tRNA hydrolase, PTH1 family
MKLIIGLGNPEKKYENNRHNIGWKIIDTLHSSLEAPDWKDSEKFHSHISQKDHIILVKPTTFMNLSGKSVASLLNFYKLDPENDILIVYDDKDMLFGKLRLKTDSGSGGHNGIKSIIDSIGTQNFQRLKFGVGQEDQKIPTDAFVLQDFSADEEQQLPTLIDKAVSAIKEWLET